MTSVSAPCAPSATNLRLVRATLPWAREQRARTWIELALAALVYGAGIAVALAPLPLVVRLAGSATVALTTTRLFSFLHDAEHRAIFRDSPAGRVAIWTIGALTSVCPPVWRDFHDRHHRTAARVLTADLAGIRGGDFLNRVVDASAWNAWPRGRRITYRIVRSPLFLAAGYLTAFVIGACLTQVARDPRRNAIALVPLAAHVAWLGALALIGGPSGLVLAGLLPTIVAAALGTWLFFIMHSFPGVEYQRGERWDYVHAALRGSSFLVQPRWMHWFTGNLGYHHVHHLNPKIPFYRLPEVMAAIPELQQCLRVTWAPRDMAACLRVQAWSDVAGPLPDRSSPPPREGKEVRT